jgi:hypothetical protein
MRTPTEQQALAEIKAMIQSHVGDAIEQFAEILARVPESDLDPAIFGGIGKLLVRELQKADLSESTQWSLPFAFCELLRERMRERRMPAHS